MFFCVFLPKMITCTYDVIIRTIVFFPFVKFFVVCLSCTVEKKSKKSQICQINYEVDPIVRQSIKEIIKDAW